MARAYTWFATTEMYGLLSNMYQISIKNMGEMIWTYRTTGGNQY